MASVKEYYHTPLYVCEVCGGRYGRTNLTYNGVEIWVFCECGDPDKAYFVNTNNARLEGVIVNLSSSNDFEAYAEAVTWSE